MTFRAKPVVKRAHRPSWESQDRRNFYLNLGFGIVVLVAVVILAHRGRTDLVQRAPGVGRQRRRPVDHQGRVQRPLPDRGLAPRRGRPPDPDRDLAGHMTEAAGPVAAADHRPAAQQLDAIALERLIDAKLQAKLAAEEGVTAARDRRRRPARRPRPRPRSTPRLGHRGRAGDRPRARSTRRPHRRPRPRPRPTRRSGTCRAARPGTRSPRPSRPTPPRRPRPATSAGSSQDDAQVDEAFLNAVFAAASNTPTEVIEGDDGIFRIGRVTEIAPETVDAAYKTKIENGGIDLANYRAVVAGDVIHQKLDDKIVADAIEARPAAPRQRDLHPGAADRPRRSTRSRPATSCTRRTTTRRRRRDLPADDPAWAAAEAEARATYAEAQGRPEPVRLDRPRGERRGRSARGPTGTRRQAARTSTRARAPVDEAFLAAILEAGPAAGAAPRAGQVRLRLARDPVHVPADRRCAG